MLKYTVKKNGKIIDKGQSNLKTKLELYHSLQEQFWYRSSFIESPDFLYSIGTMQNDIYLIEIEEIRI